MPPKALGFFGATGRLGLFLARVSTHAATSRWYFDQILEQTARVIFRTFVPIIAVIAPFGMIVGVQGSAILDLFGAHTTLPSLVAMLMLREVAPLMVGIMLCLQSGSGFAGELGTMRVKDEIDATEIMAVDSIALQVIPRILAITVAAPVLYTIAAGVGVAGGWIASIGPNLSSGFFFSSMFDFLGPMDLLGGAIKAVAFGFVAGCVSCWQGYHSERGARGVARSTNRAVVLTVLLNVVMNYFLSSALYGVIGA